MALVVVCLAGLGLLLPVSSAARSVYISSSNASTASQYDIDPTTGNLTAKDPATVGTGIDPYAVAISPDGKSAYVVNYTANTVSQYDIDPTTGNLTAKDPATVGTGAGPQFVAVNPDGKSAYVTSVATNSVYQYDINPTTGNLTAKDPESVGTGTGPRGIAIGPDGESAYVASYSDNTVSQYNIDPTTGTLTAKDPVAVTAARAFTVAVSPDGKNFYATSRTTSIVSQFDIDPTTGNLTAKDPATVGTGSRSNGIAVSPDGKSAYVANYSANTISQYDIDPTTGNLTAKDPATVGTASFGIAVSPDSKSAYVVNSGANTVSQHDIDPTTGNLTAKDPATVGTGLYPRGVAIVPNQAPTAVFTVVAGYAGEASSFSASGSTDSDGTIARYDWDFGDGETLNDGGSTPSHTYSSVGNYTATLTLTDNEGCSTTFVFTGQTASCNGSSTAITGETVDVGVAAQPGALPETAPGVSTDTTAPLASNLKIKPRCIRESSRVRASKRSRTRSAKKKSHRARRKRSKSASKSLKLSYSVSEDAEVAGTIMRRKSKNKSHRLCPIGKRRFRGIGVPGRYEEVGTFTRTSKAGKDTTKFSFIGKTGKKKSKKNKTATLPFASTAFSGRGRKGTNSTRISGSDGKKLNLGPGTYKVDLNVTDSAGNVSKSTVKFWVLRRR